MLVEATQCGQINAECIAHPYKWSKVCWRVCHACRVTRSPDVRPHCSFVLQPAAPLQAYDIYVHVLRALEILRCYTSYDASRVAPEKLLGFDAVGIHDPSTL